MQDTITVPTVSEAYEQNNKYYLKTFLIDDSIARNGMGVVPEYIPKNINKFVGKPVILTPYFNHPHEFDHYQETKDPKVDVPELYKLQEPYKIGQIIDVSTSSNVQQGGNTVYSALLEVTDPKAISAFRDGKIPLYVSPSIYRINESDPVHAITDYEALHIAIVDNPAYGFHKANIRQTCQGGKSECQRMLAQASDKVGLGYCVEKTLNDLKNVLETNSSFHSSNVHNASVQMAEENNNNSAQTTTEVVNNPTQEIQQQQVEQPKQEEQRTPINTPITGSPSLTPQEAPTEEQKQADSDVEAPCEKAAREFDERIALYDKKLKELEDFKANYEKQAEENKVTAKRNKIESAVPKDYANSEEERAKVIESLMNVGDDQLEIILNNFVIPATNRNVRQASNRRPKVTDFVQTNEPMGKNVVQASANKIEELDRLFKFSYGIVPKSKNEGGIM